MTVDDVYCGVYSSDLWPLREPLVVEVEVPRGSFLVASVEVNATLPALRRFLRRRLQGVPVCDLAWPLSYESWGVYRADYWHCVEGALVLALEAFKEDGDRLFDWLASLHYTAQLREGIVPLEARRASTRGRTR
ncbi:MAG: hypothetical protein WD939_04295 [Dehalococcoidia bacterium]